MGRKFSIGMSILLEYMSIACLFWLNGDRAVTSFFILHSISSVLFGCNIRHFLMFSRNNRSIMGAGFSSFLVFFSPIVALLGILVLLDFLFGSKSSEDSEHFWGSGIPIILEKSGATFSEKVSDSGIYCDDQKMQYSRHLILHEKRENKHGHPGNKGGDNKDPLRANHQIEPSGSHLIQVNRLEHPLSDLSPSGLPSSIIKTLSIHHSKEKNRLTDNKMHDQWTHALQDAAIALSHQNNAQVLLLLHRMHIYLKQNGYSECALGKDLIKEIPKKLLNPIIEEMSFQKKQFDNVMQMMGALEAKLRP